MKSILLFITSCAFVFQIKAQTIEAHYVVKSLRQIPLANDNTKEIILEWEGLIFQSGVKTICYLVPQYLNQYPTGIINFTSAEGSTVSYMLSTDTIQMPELYNLDSLRLWKCNNLSSDGYKQYSTRKFEQGKTKWKLLPETKIINGLQCQHASVFNGSTCSIVHDIWFYPDVAMEFGFLGIRDAPGLIVECSSPLANISYTLKYFKKGEEIVDATFLPAIFNKVKFEELPPILKINNGNNKPTVGAKKSAIMNEQ